MQITWQIVLVQIAAVFAYLAVILLPVWALTALARKLMGAKRVSGFLPNPAPRASWLARTTETVALMMLAGGIVGTSVMWYSGFDLSSWNGSHSDLVWINNANAIAVTSCVLLSGVIALCWRTGPALTLSVMGLGAYALVADGAILAKLIPDNRPMPTEADCPFEIMTGDNTVGADVWVNGVYFGQTPVKTTLAEILKVPKWRAKELNGSSRMIPGWLHLGLRWDVLDWDKLSNLHDQERHLFVQFSLNGEPMEFGGSWSGPTLSLDKRARKWNTSPWSVSHAFPKYRDELKRLVTWLQLHDYRFDDEWLAAFESYGDPGFETLRAAAKNDPQALAVFDHIVDRQYQLDQVRTPDEAWSALERIAAEADRTSDYASNTLAGLAVDRIAPKLDARRVALFVRDAMRRHPTVNSGSTQGHFGEDSMFLAPYPRGAKRGSNEAPVSAFVWAHAVWQLDRSLDQLDDSRDNPLEEILVPYFLIERDGYLQEYAKTLGGSVFDRWQRWRMSHPDNGQMVHVGNEFVTLSDWNAANSKSPAGKKWRAEHPDSVIKFAESLTNSFIFSSWDKLEFLFLDHDGTDQSVAARFWPRFRELITKNHSGFDPSNMPHRWEYLRRLEPLPTVDMYFNCWLDMKPDTPLSHDINQTVRRIPKEKSLPLLRKIIDRLEADLAEITDKHASRSYQLKNQLGTWTTIRDELTLTPAERFAKLCESSNPWNAPDLLNRSFDDPMFAQLVESPSSQARHAFVNFLKTQPTPRHREWLTKLSTDPDKPVSTAATEALESLKAQANTPPPKRKFSPPAAKLGDITFKEPPLKPE